ARRRHQEQGLPVIPFAIDRWLEVPDFAGVRGPDALARLPKAERQEWQKLWAEVADTLARAGTIPPPAQAGGKGPAPSAKVPGQASPRRWPSAQGTAHEPPPAPDRGHPGCRLVSWLRPLSPGRPRDSRPGVLGLGVPAPRRTGGPPRRGPAPRRG